MRVKPTCVKQKSKTRKLNVKLLNDPTVKAKFQHETEVRFKEEAKTRKASNASSTTKPESLWSTYKTILTQTAEENLGRIKRTPKKPWISQEVLDLAEEKVRKERNTDTQRHLYNNLRAEIQRIIRRDKAAWLDEQCKQINEYDNIGKSKAMFEQIRSVKNKSITVQQACIKDPDGKVLNEMDDIMNRWKEYGGNLFDKPEGDEPLLLPETPIASTEPPPLLSEIEQAINKLKNGKSPGLDGIPAELIESTGKHGIDALHQLCISIWTNCEWPEDWKIQEFVMLYKSGDPKICSNYRTIALISHTSKILLMIIINRLKAKTGTRTTRRTSCL